MSKNKPAMEDIYKSIGDNENLRKCVDYLRKGYFVNQDSFVDWWYDSNNKGLGRSPYEVCKEGKQKELENILMDIFTGAQGG